MTADRTAAANEALTLAADIAGAVATSDADDWLKLSANAASKAARSGHRGRRAYALRAIANALLAIEVIDADKRGQGPA